MLGAAERVIPGTFRGGASYLVDQPARTDETAVVLRRDCLGR